MQAGFEFEQPQTNAVAQLPSLDGINKLAIDTETTTEPWLFDRTLAGISWYLPDGRKGYAGIRHPGGGNHPEENVREWVRREWQGKELVVANGKHEHHTFKKWGIDLEAQDCSFKDVFHAAALINEKRYKLNMDIIAQEELGYQKTQMQHKLLHQLPVNEAAPVAIEDAWLAWRLDEAYEPKIRAEELETVLQLENDLIFATCEMERNGSYIDVDLLVRWIGEVRDEFEKRVLEIYRLTGLRIAPTRASDMSKLFVHLNIQNDFKTEGGDESFEEDALMEFVHLHPAILLALEARQLHSLDSKYLKKYLASVRPDGRIYYSLHQLRSDEGGTITGRYSSSAMYKAKEGGINIQQVTKTKKMPKLLRRWPIRRLFIAPSGRRYFSSDASQIEFRLFAHYASTILGRDRLAQKYREDPKTDFHEVVQQWTGQNRDHTKNINFRKLYGGGPAKGMMMINKVNKLDGKPLISLQDAYDMDNKYDREFPEAKLLLSVAENQAKTVGFVRTLLGRRTRFDKDSELERYYKALNMALQGGATGDLVKLKMRHLHQERKSLDFVARDQVHDEINGDVPNDECGSKLATFMNQQEHPLEVPILWESRVGDNWEDAKALAA